MQEQEDNSGNVSVLCRFRPLNSYELSSSDQVLIELSEDQKTVMICPQSGGYSGDPMRFSFDYIFPPGSAQVEVFEKVGVPIVEAVMKGINSTVFAYGQTSSGKTFTMSGPDIEDVELMGLIPRMVSSIFQEIYTSPEYIEYSVKVSYAEIYLEKVRDLLNSSKVNLAIHEDKNRGVYIADLTENYVSSELEVYNLIEIGSKNREVGHTHMNADSSRSHSLFSVTLSQTNTLDYSARTGKLYLVDLAGSERVGKTGAEGKRLEEAKNINKSLTTLGIVINNLTDEKSTFIPYRDSKLTRVLQDSLGGYSKTVLIITCSPAMFNEMETISTLRFGIRAKFIKNKPMVNRELTIAEMKLMISAAKEEIEKRNLKIKTLENSIQLNGLSALRMSSIPDIRLTITDTAMEGVETELEETRARLNETVQEHNALKEEIEHFKEEYENGQEELLNFKTLCEQQKETIKRYTAEMNAKEDTIEELSLTIESLKNELLVLNTATSEIEQEMQKIQEEFQKMQHDTRNTREQYFFNHKKYSLEQKQMNQLLNVDITVPGDQASMEKEIRDVRKRGDAMEKELRKVKNMFNTLNAPLSDEDKELVKKNEVLERNLEKVTLMYHQLVSQKGVLGVDNQVNERKIKRLNDKHAKLQDSIKKAKEKLAEEQLQVIKLMEVMQSFETGVKFSANPSTAKNIKKTIRGGGGRDAGLLFHKVSPNNHSQLQYLDKYRRQSSLRL